MNIGDRVVIGGRTMLRPGFSLVGLEGIVMPLAPQVPPGCLTVLIDWQGQGYQNEDGDLPLFVNIPTAHLEPAADKTAPEEKEEAQPMRPILGLVRPQPGIDETVTDEAPEEAPPEELDKSATGQSPDEPQGEERPRLRLI
ncbi:MAG TPA: hypothetical protein VM821_07025 [Abditibacteriaceae bacterium]|nr:hypothetical protein [Abditibacteriaceae bacterium]